MKVDLDHLNVINKKIWEYREEYRAIEKMKNLWIGLITFLFFELLLLVIFVPEAIKYSFLFFFFLGIFLSPSLLKCISLIKTNKEKRKNYSEYHEICKDWSECLNLEYQSNKPRGSKSSLLKEYRSFNIPFSRHFIYDMMKGKYGLYHVKVIDYSYWYGESESQYNLTLLLVDVDFNALNLVISPKTHYIINKEKLKRFQFEFDDFNQAFDVYGEDKRFAFDIIHPRMMEYLLHAKEIKISLIEMNRRSMIFVHEGFLYKSRIPSLLDFAHGFLEKVPSYILGGTGTEGRSKALIKTGAR